MLSKPSMFSVQAFRACSPVADSKRGQLVTGDVLVGDQFGRPSLSSTFNWCSGRGVTFAVSISPR